MLIPFMHVRNFLGGCMISAEVQSLAWLWLAGGVPQVSAAAEDGSLPERQRLARAQAVEDKDIHRVLHWQDLLSL